MKKYYSTHPWFYCCGKVGVYLLTDLTNGCRYVGSSINLIKRLWTYEACTDVNKYLYHGNYYIGVLEYCDASEVREKELYYIRIFETEFYKGSGYNKKCPVTGVFFSTLDGYKTDRKTKRKLETDTFWT